MENNKEIERMNELAFGKKKAKVSPSKEKQNLNESVVGVGAINSPFLQREKTDYELAFEHYMNEEANKDNTLIEELKAENELLKEVIKEKLTEAEIEEIFGGKKRREKALRQDFITKANIWKKKGAIRGMNQEMLDALMDEAEKDNFEGKPGYDPKTKLMTYRPGSEINWGGLGLASGGGVGQGG